MTEVSSQSCLKTTFMHSVVDENLKCLNNTEQQKIYSNSNRTMGAHVGVVLLATGHLGAMFF